MFVTAIRWLTGSVAHRSINKKCICDFIYCVIYSASVHRVKCLVVSDSNSDRSAVCCHYKAATLNHKCCSHAQ